jgi:hypothetical protein
MTRRNRRRNPVANELSSIDIALVVGGVAVVGTITYLFWNASTQAAQLAAQEATGVAGTSPSISVADTVGPTAPTPITMIPTIGLASGYYWESLGTTQSPSFGSSIEAIAMSPDDVASAVYGNVISGAGSNVTFLVTSYGDTNSGLSIAQEITLPVSFVVPA